MAMVVHWRGAPNGLGIAKMREDDVRSTTSDRYLPRQFNQRGVPLKKPKPQHSLYVKAEMSEISRRKLIDFLRGNDLIKNEKILDSFHITIYLAEFKTIYRGNEIRPISLRVPIEETRLMVMAPGGENPRPDIDPMRCAIGARIRRGAAREYIYDLRREFYHVEDSIYFGRRKKSSNTHNAYGAKIFQPHFTMTESAALIEDNLRDIGEKMRSEIKYVSFDKMYVNAR
jgi:hypothetical protein